VEEGRTGTQTHIVAESERREKKGEGGDKGTHLRWESGGPAAQIEVTGVEDGPPPKATQIRERRGGWAGMGGK
jgi:hypothetical protein